MTEQSRDRSVDTAYKRRFLMPALLLALGLGSVLMLVANHWIHDVLITARLEAMRTVGELRTQSAIVHVWIEELVTGDSIDRQGIEDRLRNSEQLLRSIAEAEASDSWFDWYIDGSGEDVSEVRRGIASAGMHLRRFANLSRLRLQGFDHKGDVGIGSEIDITYDEIFESLHLELDHLWATIEGRLAKAGALDQALSRSLALAWIAIVVLALGAVWTHERRRREAELALRESEAQLFQAQKMEALGRLAGGIAHDINNHLAAIAMQCEAVKLMSQNRDQLHKRIDAIIDTAGRSATLIKRLLTLSRKQPVRPAIINVHDVIADLGGILDSVINESVELETRLEAPHANTSMDNSQLEQVILNLAVNACEAMESGGRLLIETTNLTEQGSEWICLHVRDSGIGMADDMLERIFDPFFTTKDIAQNSGLGLASVDAIVRQNNGKIHVTSELGKGSSFRVFLPATDQPADRNIKSAEVAKRADPVGLGNAILLVEDNDDLRTSTAAVLRSLGYQVHTAAHGKAGLALFTELAAEIDLAIVDVIMPGMDGKQLVDAMRRLQPALNVLFISGYTDNRLAKHGIIDEDVNLLAKPFTVKDLIANVQALVGRRDSKERVA